MHPPTSLFLRQRFFFLWACLAFALTSQAAQAGSATWALDPDQFELWTNPANWMLNTVPDGATDTATFGVAKRRAPAITAEIEVGSIVFEAGASSSDDIKASVRALRADTVHCNGKIGVVGASSGDSHAVYVAINKTLTPGDAWPHWFKDGHDDRPDCAASLSGAYDFSDRTPESYGGDPDPLPQFNHNIENYTNSQILSYQKSVSPVALTIDPSSFKPLFLINSAHDTMPYHQIVDMICALRAAQVDDTAYKTLTIPNSSEHAFEYWNSWDGQPPVGLEHTHNVSDDVIGFLNEHLMSP